MSSERSVPGLSDEQRAALIEAADRFALAVRQVAEQMAAILQPMADALNAAAKTWADICEPAEEQPPRARGGIVTRPVVLGDGGPPPLVKPAVDWSRVKLVASTYGAWHDGRALIEPLIDSQPGHPLLTALLEHHDHHTSAYYTALGYIQANCSDCDREIWNREVIACPE